MVRGQRGRVLESAEDTAENNNSQERFTNTVDKGLVSQKSKKVGRKKT